MISNFYKKYQKEVLDIILFGSSIKGKDKPRDFDILLLFKENENLNIAYELRKKFERLKIKSQIVTKTYERLFDKNFKAREAFLGEGYSLIRKQFISNSLGYTNIAMFKYELKGFSQTKRMRLQYALYGRDKKSGIVKEFRLNKFADTIFFCPMDNLEKVKEFFEGWKIKHDVFPILIPERILY